MKAQNLNLKQLQSTFDHLCNDAPFDDERFVMEKMADVIYGLLHQWEPDITEINGAAVNRAAYLLFAAVNISENKTLQKQLNVHVQKLFKSGKMLKKTQGFLKIPTAYKGDTFGLDSLIPLVELREMIRMIK